VETAGALDIHEITVGRLDQSLQLVLIFLVGEGRIEEIFGHIGLITVEDRGRGGEGVRAGSLRG
jgi:hypothetical protein